MNPILAAARREEAGAWKTYSVVTTFLFVCLSIILPLAWIFARPLIGRVMSKSTKADETFS